MLDLSEVGFGLLGVYLRRLFRMLIDIIGCLDMGPDDLLHQIRLLSDQLVADHQAATGMVGPHLAGVNHDIALALQLDYGWGRMGQEYSIYCSGRDGALGRSGIHGLDIN